jgi:hypothetical protein
MKKVTQNKKITLEDLAVMVAKGFENMATKQEMDAGFKSVYKILEDMEYRLGKIESNHERRLDLLEDKMLVVKTYFERNPHLKVKF